MGEREAWDDLFPAHNQESWKILLLSAATPNTWICRLLVNLVECLEQSPVVILLNSHTAVYEALGLELGFSQDPFASTLDLFLSRCHKILMIGMPDSRELEYTNTIIINEETESRGSVSKSSYRVTILLTSSPTECLDSLHFPELFARRDRVEKSANGTNEWIWTHSTYSHWINEESGLLWIYGKPGSGKSTLAAEIVHANDFKGQGYLVADFFYSARGGSTETSHTLMLRSILFQLLVQDDDLYPAFQQPFRRFITECYPAINANDWKYLDLRAIIQSLKEFKFKERLKFLLLLDGLDESEDKAETGEERHEVFSLLSSLCAPGSRNIFKIIALSRAERDVRGALQAKFYIDMKDVNKADITRIVNLGTVRLWRQMRASEDDLQLGTKFPTHDSSGFDADLHVGIDSVPEASELDFVADYLLAHADGVILWVVMIIRELLQIAESGAFTVQQLRKILSSIPTSLHELYLDILGKVKTGKHSNLKQAKYIFSWVLFAGRTLRVDEFRDVAAMFHRDESSKSEDFLQRNRVGHYTKSWNPTRTLIANLCGALIEIVPSDKKPSSEFWDNRNVSGDDSVQLIHQTAKDFLLSNPDPSIFSLDHPTALDVISRACNEYLMMTFPVNKKSPAFTDVTWPDQVACEALVVYLENHPLLKYILHYLPQLANAQCWTYERRTMVFNNLVQYLRQTRVVDGSMWWLIREIDFDFEPELLKTTPCSVGCQAKLLEPISIQNSEQGMKLQEESSQLDRIERLYIRRKKFLDDCLIQACKFGLLNAMETLVAAGAKLNGAEEYQESIERAPPISAAAASGQLLAVRWLLNEGADPNRPDGRENPPLLWAVSEGYVEVVRELLKSGKVRQSLELRRVARLAILKANKPGGEEIVTLLKEEYGMLAPTEGSIRNSSSEDLSTPLSDLNLEI
jgi:hypothetical protein